MDALLADCCLPDPLACWCELWTGASLNVYSRTSRRCSAVELKDVAVVFVLWHVLGHTCVCGVSAGRRGVYRDV